MKYERIEVTLLKCSWCSKYLGNLSGGQYYFDGVNDYYCPDCALKLGIIDALEWLKIKGVSFLDTVAAATYADGIVTYLERCDEGLQRRELRIFDERGNRIEEEAAL